MRNFRRRRARRRPYLAGIAAAVGSMVLLLIPVFVLRRRAGTGVTTSPQPTPGASLT